MMAYLGWGDGIAPVIGKRFGKHKYKILSEKSIEGSLAFLIFGFLAAVFFNYLIFGKIGFIQILITGIVAMISEAISPRDADNLIIPIVISILYIFIYGNFI